MSDTASAWLMRWLRGTAVLARYQNHWPGRLITWEGVSWAPLAFAPSALVGGDATVEAGASVQLPFDAISYPQVLAAQERGDYWELRQYAFDPTDADLGPPVTMTLQGAYLGQVVDAEVSGLAMIDVGLGAPLAPAGASFPPRTITTPLIGVPPQV